MIYAKKLAELKSKLGNTRFNAALAHIDKDKPGYLNKSIEALEAELENPSPIAPVVSQPLQNSTALTPLQRAAAAMAKQPGQKPGYQNGR